MNPTLNPEILTKLGINISNVSKIHSTLEELKKTTPGMVIGKALRTFKYMVNQNDIEEYEGNTKKIMSLYMFDKLQYDQKGILHLVPAEETFKDVYKPYNGEDLSNKTLLVWRTGGIGDLLFIQPNLIFLKNKYPTCKIIFGTIKQNFPLVNNWKCISGLVPLPMDLETLKMSDYHLTFEGAIERCLEATYTNAYVLFSKYMGLNLDESLLKPYIPTKSKNNTYVLQELEKYNVKPFEYICCQIRASSPIRTPSLHVWESILIPLAKQGYKIIINDKPSMTGQINNMISMTFPIELRNNVFNFCPSSTQIDIAASLCRFAKLVIAPDSSMIHISAAVGTPVFGIYGPFSGNIRMSTYNNADWIEPDGSRNICKYGGKWCFLHGHTPCPSNDHGASPCFNEINFELALEKINNLLKIERK